MRFFSTNYEKFLYKDIMESVQNVLDRGEFILNSSVENIEEEISKYVGTKYAVAVSSGSDALHIALESLQLPKGSEVITTSFSFFATTEAILLSGHKPVFCDIDSDFNIDIKKIEELITEKTKVILPVHLYGNPCNMEKILLLAKKYDLYVIEDCAQALGASYLNKKLGSYGHLACLSFYPTKNLGAYGDGGMILTDDEAFYNFCRVYRNQGAEKPYKHIIRGKNSRFDALQAEILKVKLPYLDEWNKIRRKNAMLYNSLLSGVGDIKLPNDSGNHIYHQYTIYTNQRNYLAEYLNSKDIPYGIYYPTPIHLQPLFGDKYKDLYLPNTISSSENVISLPIFPGIKEEEIYKIAFHIKNFYRSV
ncbi:hypothetical protein COM46_21745 [Bacillus pseudomycoides]|uniref:DegT/DnrJ/EryC1/StrS family aminotransferase n=1 Tax=Bacillus pseudomycoides TaxID=64104 RepID=UPI000BF5B495|nr:DegT/DnrJ/EryC1/StrS family aminotransferase [Bacillus pseudomycoides]PGD73705.1 hypothetical protein COM46_21745 [Bacillus pseudomycoides]